MGKKNEVLEYPKRCWVLTICTVGTKNEMLQRSKGNKIGVKQSHNEMNL